MIEVWSDILFLYLFIDNNSDYAYSNIDNTKITLFDSMQYCTVCKVSGA